MPTSPIPAYATLRASIDADKRQRILAHQLARSAALRMAAVAGGGTTRLNLIAQGDSWFDYPLPLLDPSDVIAHLKHLPGMAPTVLDLAHHGEAMEDMLGVAKLHTFIAQLQDPASGPFDAILFSGGGNDLAGNQFRLWLQDVPGDMDPAKGLDAARVACVLGVIKAGYEDLVVARDRHAPHAPIFAHDYDFAIPDGRGVCNTGPWLKPGLDDRGWISQQAGAAIVKQLLQEFAAMLDGFEASVPNFVHVRTQGTLRPAQWANELHPTPDGFAAIAGKFVETLQLRFPGRV